MLINDVTLGKLYDMVSSADFSNVVDCDDVEVSVTNFTRILYDAYSRCCPIKIKTISPKLIRKPWITKEILSNVRKMNSFLLVLRQNRISRTSYTRFKNFVTGQIRNSKKTYYLNKFENYRSNMNKVGC